MVDIHVGQKGPNHQSFLGHYKKAKCCIAITMIICSLVVKRVNFEVTVKVSIPEVTFNPD